MRFQLLFIPLLMTSVPAAAQSAPPALQLPPELTDPATADRLSDAMQALSSIFLDMKVGGVQAAVEGREPTPSERNLRVRDLGKVDEKQLQQQIAEAKPQIQAHIKAFQKALPEMMKSLDQAQKSLDRLTANMPDPNYPKR
jgi:hypothetical protein